METIVIGHRNPDMDSICAAVGYAELKRLTGHKNVIAGRAGSTNERIDFVLNKFGVEAPVLVNDLAPRVRDVMHRDVVSISKDSSVYDAVQVIEQSELRGLPVTDEACRCLGLLSPFKVLQHLFPSREEATSTRVVTASLMEIVRTFGGTSVVGDLCEELRDHVLVVGAMAAESFRTRIQNYADRDVVLIVGNREEVQLTAIEGKVRAVVVTGGMPISEKVTAAAKKSAVTLASSPYDTATTVLLARGAVKVEQKLDSDYLSFSPDTLLETAREAAAANGQGIFPVLEDCRLVGVVSKSDLLRSVARQLILVDHNEMSQAVSGADKVPIIEVLDHHRIGGFSTDTPILFWNNPVGSTSTIVSLCYQQNGVEIPKPVAGLLMAGLISDTLNLTSPTTTPVDGKILRHLADIVGIEPALLAGEIFSVGSPLLTLTPDQAVVADCKEYDENGSRFTVAQIEELSFAHFFEKQEVLIAALQAHCEAGRYLFAALLVTNINTQTSRLLVCGDENFMQRIDYPRLEPNQWELVGVVSRKKQLLPYLLGCLSGMPAAK